MESNTPTPGSDDRKRAYATPEFRKYGRLAQITETVGSSGSMDSMNGSAKTSVN